MPPWLETVISVAAALAAILFFAKYRETAAALQESERIKGRLSENLQRYRDMPQLRALRDALAGKRILPQDDEGREHILIRGDDKKLYHISLHRQAAQVAENGKVTYLKDGAEVPLEEL
ncbi:MAG: hypothetical protein K0U59_10315 [Gammaproteobacteria bacterium]|nr:hypothetical protein [Gammaproteobacteria bacterium]